MTVRIGLLQKVAQYTVISYTVAGISSLISEMNATHLSTVCQTSSVRISVILINSKLSILRPRPLSSEQTLNIRQYKAN